MEPTLNQTQNHKVRNILIVVAIILSIVALGALIVLLMRQPSQKDYQAAKDTQVGAITTAREALQPAVNEYLAAFKAAYNQSGSPQEASNGAKKQYDAYKQAERNAGAAMEALEKNRVSNNGEVGEVVRQVKRDYEAEVTYLTGLVESYPAYTVLFSPDQKQCSGIFVGETTGLSDRKQKLDAAAKACYQALDKLKLSKNVTYVDYAKKIERRVKQLQAYSAATVRSEQTNKEYEAQAAVMQQKVSEAFARNASEEELNKLTGELKQLNAKITENRAEFDFASRHYIDTVKELPTLFGNVYDKEVPAKLKNFAQLHDMRMGVLGLILEDKLADQAR